jgi:hypothetical protein
MIYVFVAYCCGLITLPLILAAIWAGVGKTNLENPHQPPPFV